MKEIIRKRMKGLFAFALSMCMLFGSTMCVEAATYNGGENFHESDHVVTQLSGVSELYEGDVITCSSGAFRIYYDGDLATGTTPKTAENGDTFYRKYVITAVPGGEGHWHIDNISHTSEIGGYECTNCYTIELSSVIEGDGGETSGTVEHTSRDARERHKTTDSKKYDYVETENGIAYGGYTDGKWSATTMVPASAYPKFGKFVEKKISQAESGKDVVMNCEPWTSLPKEVLEAFAAKGDISLTLNYTYEGNRYTVKIPAGTDISTLVDENGYSGLAFLGAKFGAVPYTEPEEK